MGKTAVVFAGQGAQYAGMGKSFYDTFPSVRAFFDRAESMRPGTLETCFFGNAESLRDTANTQPCLYLANMGAAIALRSAASVLILLRGFPSERFPRLPYPAR